MFEEVFITKAMKDQMKYFINIKMKMNNVNDYLGYYESESFVMSSIIIKMVEITIIDLNFLKMRDGYFIRPC